MRLILDATEAKRQSLAEEIFKIEQGVSEASRAATRSSMLEAEAKILQVSLLLKKLRGEEDPNSNKASNNSTVDNNLDPLAVASRNSVEYWRLVMDSTEARMKSLQEEQIKIENGNSAISRSAIRADLLELEAKRLQIALLLKELDSKPKSQPPSNPPSNPNSALSNPPKFVPPASTSAIQPGEVLTIESAAMPEINRNIIVAADQTIVIPIVGVFSVKDLNQKELRKELNKAYEEFAKNPLIDVFREIPSRTGDQIPLKSTTPIQAGEVLTVESMNDETFNRQVIVQEDLSITVPLVGNVQAKGLTPEELSKKLNVAAKQFVNRPFIQVFRGNVTRPASAPPVGN